MPSAFPKAQKYIMIYVSTCMFFKDSNVVPKDSLSLLVNSAATTYYKDRYPVKRSKIATVTTCDSTPEAVCHCLFLLFYLKMRVDMN